MERDKEKVKTIRDQVYLILRDEICRGVYESGAWLQEVELSKRLGVSRSPVRETLRQLVFDGLLVEIPNKGVFVKEFSLRDIEEIFDMRVILESYGILRGEENLTNERIQQLNDALARLNDAYRNDDMAAYADADENLHTYLVHLGNNRIVNETYERIQLMNNLFRFRSMFLPGRLEASLKEHAQIVHALVKRDFQTAAAENRHHLELACMRIKERRQNNSNG